MLDVAGDNEALVARNGSGVNTIADLKGKRIGTPFASTAHYSLLAALSQNGLSANDVQLVDLQPQAILAAWDRGDIDAAYTWLPTLDQLRKTRQGPDHQPPVGQGRQADAGPRLRCPTSSPTAHSERRRHLASAGGPRAQRHPRRPAAAAAKPSPPRSGWSPRGGGRPAQAGRLPDTGPGRFAGMAWRRARAGQHRGQPAERRRSSSPTRSRSRRRRRCRRSRTRSTPRGCPVPSPSNDRSHETDDNRHVKRTATAAGDEVTALGPVDLTVDPDRSCVLVGASGCGKSTLLRLLAGFESPSEGHGCGVGARADARRDGRCGVPAAAAVPVAHGRRQRRAGAQVREGAAGAAGRTARRAAGRGRVWRVPPTARSGRSAAASSSALRSRGRWRPRRRCSCSTSRSRRSDALTRERLQEDVRQVSAESGRTTVFVTHSADEAAFLGSRIVVLTRRPGQVALDLPVDLPRTGIDADELRRSARNTASCARKWRSAR